MLIASLNKFVLRYRDITIKHDSGVLSVITCCIQVKDLKGSDIPTLESSFQSLNADIQKLTAEIAEVLLHYHSCTSLFVSVILTFAVLL